MRKLLFLLIPLLLVGLLLGRVFPVVPTSGNTNRLESKGPSEPPLNELEPAPDKNSIALSYNVETGFRPGVERRDVREELAKLSQLITEEREARLALEKEVAALRRAAAPEDSAGPGQGKRATQNFLAGPGASSEAGSADLAERLIQLGVPQGVSDAYAKKRDQIALDRLYLQDRATREGWLATERYTREAAQLTDREQALRSDMGDENYDKLLFALGQPNRVQIAAVMAGSPAEQSGLRGGDRIWSYGGKRIFSFDELRAGTTSGVPTEPTPLVVERDGKRIEMFVPRGPLGIQLDFETVAPPGSSPDEPGG